METLDLTAATVTLSVPIPQVLESQQDIISDNLLIFWTSFYREPRFTITESALTVASRLVASSSTPNPCAPTAQDPHCADYGPAMQLIRIGLRQTTIVGHRSTAVDRRDH